MSPWCCSKYVISKSLKVNRWQTSAWPHWSKSTLRGWPGFLHTTGPAWFDCYSSHDKDSDYVIYASQMIIPQPKLNHQPPPTSTTSGLSDSCRFWVSPRRRNSLSDGPGETLNESILTHVAQWLHIYPRVNSFTQSLYFAQVWWTPTEVLQVKTVRTLKVDREREREISREFKHINWGARTIHGMLGV